MRMASASLEIIRCPPSLVAEALSLALSDIAPSQRRDIGRELVDVGHSTDLAHAALYVALRDGQLCGAAWGQRQIGNMAIFWPPQLVPRESEQTAYQLAESVIRMLDDSAIEVTQSLLPASDAAAAPLLRHVGFRHLADLLYLTCEADRFPTSPHAPPEFEFVPYSGALRTRLVRLVERSYEGTLDCVALNGMRAIDDVIDGYQSTGEFRPENWLIVRVRDEDAGVLLMADHPQARHWELMYMGLAPEFRGKSWGREVTRHALWLARRAGVERIVLAVDAANGPALAMYRSTGFETWDRRTVYVRFPAKTPA